MTVDHYLIGRLAEAMYGNGTSVRERLAVGCAIRNRAIGGVNWYNAITECGNLLPDNPADPAFQRCLWDAENIFHNREHDLSGGATQWASEPRSESVKVGGLYFTAS